MGSRSDFYSWPPVCISWGQEAVGFRLDTYNCLHFLRQEIDGLQLRNLQSASCLPSKMEVTTEAG